MAKLVPAVKMMAVGAAVAAALAAMPIEIGRAHV